MISSISAAFSMISIGTRLASSKRASMTSALYAFSSSVSEGRL